MKNFFLACIIFSFGIVAEASFLKDLFNKSSVNSIPASDTYVLAIGVCPPWKVGMGNYCKHAVTQITEIVQQRMNIPKANIHTVLDAQATYEGVEKGFAWLQAKTNKNSRAIIYINAHGGPDPDGSGVGLWNEFRNRHKGHELFALWTIDVPFSIDYAIESKQWMLATHVREMLDNIIAQKIMIIEACRAGTTEDDFLRTEVANKHEAFIFSSPPLSVALTNIHNQIPLFTSYLVQAIAQESNLEEAFSKAKEKTILKALRGAINNKDCLIRGGGDVCAQLPMKEDPDNILKQVTFSGSNFK